MIIRYIINLMEKSLYGVQFMQLVKVLRIDQVYMNLIYIDNKSIKDLLEAKLDFEGVFVDFFSFDISGGVRFIKLLKILGKYKIFYLL